MIKTVRLFIVVRALNAVRSLVLAAGSGVVWIRNGFRYSEEVLPIPLHNPIRMLFCDLALNASVAQSNVSMNRTSESDPIWFVVGSRRHQVLVRTIGHAECGEALGRLAAGV